jgi:hypothetical protein
MRPHENHKPADFNAPLDFSPKNERARAGL